MTPIKSSRGFYGTLLQILFCFNKKKRRIAQKNLFDKKILSTKKYKMPCDFDCAKTPIFIISYNQLSYVKQMVDWLKKYDFKNIHIVDNNSSYKPLLDYLKKTDCIVHHMDKNYGHTVIWSSGKFDNIITKQCYIVSDCDIAPNRNLPKNFISRLYETLGKYPYITKVGFALNIQDLPDTDVNRTVIQWEKQFWEKEIEKNLYFADIDTTFALYRPGKPRMETQQFYTALRVAGNMTAIHLPWFETSETKESKFYKETANSSASWINKVTNYASKNIERNNKEHL